MLLHINDAVKLLLFDEVKSVLDGDKNVMLDNLSIASMSLSIFFAFSCLHNILRTFNALSWTLNCVSWQTISRSLCGTL